MRYQTLVPAVVSLSVLAACTDRQTSPTALTESPTALTEDSATWAAAVTPATRTQFEGFVNFCESTAPDGIRITPGGTLHVNGARNRNLWVTGNPLIDGFEENVVDVHLNLDTGNGVVHLAVTLSPDAVDGTWEIRTQLTLRGGASIGGSGVGHGTGELQGMTIKFTIAPESGVSACNPDFGGAELRGVIISPATSG